MTRTFGFSEQLKMSESQIEKHKQIILSRFPNAIKIERANLSDDKKGIDYFITLQSKLIQRVDAKIRKEDWLAKHPNEDDVALETWSKIGEKIGWTRDPNKQTDWIMFLWEDTERSWFIPFPYLYKAFVENGRKWKKKYRTEIQDTREGWKSECVFVPRRVIFDTIYNSFDKPIIIPQEKNTDQMPIVKPISKKPLIISFDPFDPDTYPEDLKNIPDPEEEKPFDPWNPSTWEDIPMPENF